MRARDLVGRRIVEVRQQRVQEAAHGGPFTALRSLVLDNGSVIVFESAFTDDDVWMTGQLVQPDKKE